MVTFEKESHVGMYIGITLGVIGVVAAGVVIGVLCKKKQVAATNEEPLL